ncbi:MAG: penicillin-binding transpeptidase domain-containing protein [Acidimicrobiia bacterium]|nr:penicillin-binding transpeptidase domain-containing protein [Acidimicrobiia bacterium]
MFCLVGVGFVAVLVDLIVVRPDQYLDLGLSQRTRERALPAYRGSIVDRNGFVLASSTPSKQVTADPAKIIDPAATAALLAPVLGIDAAELTERLTPASTNDRYELLGRALPEDAVVAIEALKADEQTRDHLVAVFLSPEEDRIYPAELLARPVIGRVDPDEVGYYGIEDQYNAAMTGIAGSEVFEKGAFGSISVGDWSVNPAAAGYDVVLTIDHRIQFVAEQALLEHCEETGAKGATAVISVPKTGEILAMVSVARSDAGKCIIPIYNKTLLDTFEPGSVLKPITVAAAIDQLGYTADTLIDVPSRTSVGGQTFVDHPEHPGAPFPISWIMAQSSNVGTIMLSEQVGPGYLHDYQRRFGFGQLTGLGVRGEESGIVRPPETWQGSEAATISFGQGITVTSAQLAAAYNVFANNGLYQNLSLVRSLRAPDGTEFPRSNDPAKPVLSSEAAAEMTRMLSGVVTEGTGQSAAIDGFKVAGKTGTAWKVFTDANGKTGYGETGNRRYVATFAGYVPADDPEISMVIVVDEPQGAFYASAVAAPVFSKVGHYALRILAVPPDGSIPPPDTKVRAAPATVDHLGEAETAAAAGVDPQPAASAEANPAVTEAVAQEAAADEGAPTETAVSDDAPAPAAPTIDSGGTEAAGAEDGASDEAGGDSVVAGLVAGGSPPPLPDEGTP